MALKKTGAISADPVESRDPEIVGIQVPGGLHGGLGGVDLAQVVEDMGLLVEEGLGLATLVDTNFCNAGHKCVALYQNPQPMP